MNKETYLDIAIREVDRLKGLADKAIGQVSADAFVASPGEGGNSIAVLVKHLAGNMRSRWRDFLTTDGEKPDRNRDDEFELSAEDTREHLIASWDAGWALFRDNVASLVPGDLDRTVTIRSEPLSVLQAINRQLTHHAYHVGQIAFAAKLHSGAQWSSLSVPRGQSREFNEDPTEYL